MKLTQGTRKFGGRIVLSVLIDIAMAGLLYVTLNWIVALISLLCGFFSIWVKNLALSDGTKNFWLQVSSLVFMTVFLTAVVASLWSWIAAISVLVLGGFVIIWFVGFVKTALLNALPNEWNGELTRPEDCLWLDQDWLRQQTQALENIGFQHLQDYRIPEQPTFGRCMVHPQHQCYAEIGVVYSPAGERISETVVITSVLTDDWTIVHVNRDVNLLSESMLCLWRHPKSLSVVQVHPTLASLLDAHLQFRDRMQCDLGISVLPDSSWDAYVQLERYGVVHRNQALKRTNLLLGMLNVARFELNPPSQWLGDYGKKLKA